MPRIKPSSPYAFDFFPSDFRFDLFVKGKGHKKDIGRKNDKTRS